MKATTPYQRIGLALALIGLSALTAEASELAHYRTHSLEINTSTTSVGAAPVKGYQLWYTLDGGQSWDKTEAPHLGPAPVPFQAPADGHYGFLVTAFDQAGKGMLPPQPGTRPEFECVVDTQAPVLEVFRPDRSEPIYAGGQITLQWRATDASFADYPVSLEYRRLPDRVWQSILPERTFTAEGQEAWWPPFVDGELELRFRATDRAGNEQEWVLESPLRVIPFDGFRGSRVLSAAPFSSFHRVPVFYRIPEFSFIELDEVEIWVRHETGKWSRRRDADRVSPFRFEAVLDGSYYFYLRAISRNRIESRPAPGPDTPPDMRVIVDTHPPQGQLTVGSGTSTVFHRAGDPLPISWNLHDSNLSPRGCRLEYSLDDGASWRTLTSELRFRDGDGRYDWRAPLLELDRLHMRMVARDLAGNLTFVRAESNLHIINPTLDPKLASEEFYRRALFLSRQGDRSSLVSALENLDVSLTYDPENAIAWHDRGALKMLLRMPVDALEDFEKALELRPQDIPLAFSLVRALLQVSRSGAAPDADHKARARIVFSTIARVNIYKEIHYRELLQQYKLLKDSLGIE